MATVREYGYYLKGNKLSIVERDTAFDNDVSSKDYGPGSNRAQWKSPTADISKGLELQFTYLDSQIVDEGSEVMLSRYLSRAIVYYLKARMFEDAGNNNMRKANLKEFRKMLEKNESAKISGPRMIAPGPYAIR
jgi:hypothetical protein|tara:strand:+ start:133 stop:534 length:402 start_codon:yes stop_codon:yes gene_type:complete